jgi:hypothetical protein
MHKSTIFAIVALLAMASADSLNGNSISRRLNVGGES